MYRILFHNQAITKYKLMDKVEINKTKSYKDLVVWQKAHSFTITAFEQAKNFPQTHSAMVADMLRKSATAITVNIVCGYKKKDRDEKLMFLTTAQDALEESRYYIILATDLFLLDPFASEEMQTSLNEVSYLLNSYAKSIIRRKEENESRQPVDSNVNSF